MNGKGKFSLIDATQFFEKMPRSLGNKRRYLSEENINKVLSIYRAFEDGERTPRYYRTGTSDTRRLS